jgi:hypothetical protein
MSRFESTEGFDQGMARLFAVNLVRVSVMELTDTQLYLQCDAYGNHEIRFTLEADGNIKIQMIPEPDLDEEGPELDEFGTSDDYNDWRTWNYWADFAEPIHELLKMIVVD